MSTVDIWLPLSTGGRCVFPHVRTPPPDVFAGYVAAHRPDLVVLPPGYFNLCVDERPALVSGLRHVMVGGEPPSARHAATARRLRPGLAVTNIYGPTEATTYVTGGSVAADPGDIGLPLESVRLHVVDPWLRPLPAGVPGELCVAGPHVALGYYGAGAGTAAVFVPEPGGAPGVRMYRTGDLGYLGRDGRYHLLGRIDRQVKIRGHRVEPAGVEAVLRGSPRVRDVAVVARGGATARMVAFVVPHDRATPDSLARELREALPEYLCPDRIVVAAAIPRTPNGKVDSAALWSAVEALAPGVSDAPVAVGPVAAAVAQVWQDVLGVPFAPDEDFFMLGGNSFLAMRLSMRLDREFGIHLPVRAVLDSRSGSELVRRAERA
jgi:acyl-coenzyme A synthetase/AMP-(fatty) acid ligase